jgi:hypothetical protein
LQHKQLGRSSKLNVLPERIRLVSHEGAVVLQGAVAAQSGKHGAIGSTVVQEMLRIDQAVEVEVDGVVEEMLRIDPAVEVEVDGLSYHGVVAKA